MNLHDVMFVGGCITQDKFLKGRTLAELESILGYHQGRLSTGMTVVALLQIPGPNDFKLLGYSQVAEHRFNMPSQLDVDKLKQLVMNTAFALDGPNRLVKVLPNTRHNNDLSDDDQYPSGQGIPQWKLTSRIPSRVVAIVNPGERYV